MNVRAQSLTALIIVLIVIPFAFSGCRSKPDPSSSSFSPPTPEESSTPTPRAEPKDPEIRFIEQVILRAGNAFRRNTIKRAPRLEGEDEEQASLTVYLMAEFGYEKGDKITPEIISTLMKTVAFSQHCVKSGIVNSSMDIVEPEKARMIFHETFSKDEMRTFEHMDRAHLGTY